MKRGCGCLAVVLIVVGGVIAVVLFAASQISVHPASDSKPTPREKVSTEQAAQDASARYTEARAAVLARINARPDVIAQKADADRLEAALKDARKNGSEEEKLKASAAWNTVRVKLQKQTEAEIDADADVKQAKAAKDSAIAAVSREKAFRARMEQPIGTIRVGAMGKLDGFTVIQVIASDTAIVKVDDQWLWLSGMNTDGMVDDHGYKLRQPVIVTGTQSYTSVLGATKTIFAASVVPDRD